MIIVIAVIMIVMIATIMIATYYDCDDYLVCFVYFGAVRLLWVHFCYCWCMLVQFGYLRCIFGYCWRILHCCVLLRILHCCVSLLFIIRVLRCAAYVCNCVLCTVYCAFAVYCAIIV